MSEDLTGQTLGSYKLVALVGSGQISSVYRGYDKVEDRYATLKVLPAEFLTEPGFLERFRHEALHLAELTHPALLAPSDVGAAHGRPYLVLPSMPGGSLADRLEHAPLPLREVGRIFTPMAEALDYAHTQGIIHRNLKPGNILFDRDDHPFLTDFGLTAVMEATSILRDLEASGTPEYMSPEQVRGQTLDGRSDVYSLGLVAYQALTGRLPFQADTPEGLMFKQATASPRPPRALRPELPEAVDAVILKALAKPPEDRHQTASEFVQALTTATAGQDLAAQEVLPQVPALKKGGGTAKQVIVALAVSLAVLCGLPSLACLWQAYFGSWERSQRYQPTAAVVVEVVATPENPETYFNQGQAHYRQGDYEQAIADYTKVIELNPEDVDAYFNRALAYSNIDDDEQAVADYSKAIELNPTDADAYYNRGNAYRRLGDYEAAIADYTKALEINPEDVLAYNNRGNAYYRSGDIEQAIADYDKALELDPDDVGSYFDRGVAYYDLGKYEQAVADYTRAVELDPDYAPTHNYLAWTLAHDLDNNYDTALKHAQRSVELDPQASNHDTLALVYYKLKQYDKALEHYNTTLSLDDMVVSAYKGRGDVYLALGDREAALADYEAYLVLVPAGLERKEVEEAVKSLQQP